MQISDLRARQKSGSLWRARWTWSTCSQFFLIMSRSSSWERTRWQSLPKSFEWVRRLKIVPIIMCSWQPGKIVNNNHGGSDFHDNLSGGGGNQFRRRAEDHSRCGRLKNRPVCVPSVTSTDKGIIWTLSSFPDNADHEDLQTGSALHWTSEHCLHTEEQLQGKLYSTS